jgi:signal transduction histidine kinase/CheY-like chemotaxis protein
VIFFADGQYLDSQGTLNNYSGFSSLNQNAAHNFSVADLSALGQAGQEKAIFFSKFTSELAIEGKKALFLASLFPSKTIDAFFTTIRYNENSHIYLVNSDGSKVYHQANNAQDPLVAFNIFTALQSKDYFYGTSYSELIDNVGQRKSGTVHLKLDNEDYMLSYAPLTTNGFYILMAVPSKTVAVSTAAFTRRVLVSFTIIFLFIACLVIGMILIINHSNHVKELQAERAKALEEKAAAEKAANQAKSVFLSNMSHDVRTPLNGIIGMLNIASEHPDDPVVVKDSLKSIKECSDHLLSLINDVLDMSRIESGKVEVRKEPFNLLSVLDGCTSIIRGQLLDRKVDFHFDFSKVTHSNVIGDAPHLQRIIINILGNSVKFTEDGQNIDFTVEEVALSPAKALYRFSMKDTGIGMSEDFQKVIFNSFTQENRPASAKYKGTGLGMAITKQYVDLMGGTISLKSKLNEGSLFVVEIPMEYEEKEIAYERHQETVVPRPVLKGLNILLVEDNEINQKIAESLILPTEAGLVMKKNGKEGLDEFISKPEHTYDMILMDIMMPIMDGYEAAKAIRSSQKNDATSIIIIAMTADAFSEDILQAKNAGMNDHIAKPIDKNDFYRKLTKFAKQIEANKHAK